MTYCIVRCNWCMTELPSEWESKDTLSTVACPQCSEMIRLHMGARLQEPDEQ